MDILAIVKWLPDLVNAVKLAQMAVEVGKDPAKHIAEAYALAFQNKSLTDSERAQQRADEASYSSTIQAPLVD